ncbi:MAG TPA: Uma2 family endonuclease [Mucilaginibacter sp.]
MNTQHKYNRIPDVPTSAVEIYNMLPEGTRCEVIFNELVMSPSPSREHQKVLIKLTALLFQFFEDHPVGALYAAPFDVHLEPEQSVVQPDLFVVMNDMQEIVKKNGVHGVPALVIEVVSTNRAYDTRRKRALYEKAGVKEYFIIDPENKLTTLLTLNAEGVYQQTYETEGVLRSSILHCDLPF